MGFSLIATTNFLVVGRSGGERTATIDRLQALGAVRIRETDDPFDAMEIIRTGQVDVIVSEWSPLLVHFIRAAGDTKVARLPIVMMHSGLPEADLKDLRRAGVTELLSKPVDAQRLLDAIMKASPVRQPGVTFDTPDRDVLPQDWSLTQEEIETLLRPN